MKNKIYNSSSMPGGDLCQEQPIDYEELYRNETGIPWTSWFMDDGQEYICDAQWKWLIIKLSDKSSLVNDYEKLYENEKQKLTRKDTLLALSEARWRAAEEYISLKNQYHLEAEDLARFELSDLERRVYIAYKKWLSTVKEYEDATTKR